MGALRLAMLCGAPKTEFSVLRKCENETLCMFFVLYLFTGFSEECPAFGRGIWRVLNLEIQR